MSIFCADNVSFLGKITAKYKEFSENILSPLIRLEKISILKYQIKYRMSQESLCNNRRHPSD
jgi:hypothetical protein